MNAEEVVDKAWDDQQRVHIAFTDSEVVCITPLPHSLRRFIRRQRGKQSIGPSIRRGRADIVLDVFE